jgi:hypothetical protein
MRIIKPLLGFALCGMAIGVLLQLAGVYESVANVYQAILGVAFVGFVLALLRREFRRNQERRSAPPEDQS